MFLKKLLIENDDSVIREIRFHKGINLIVDETLTNDKKKSGNNVGKTTVLRLIDFCLGNDGINIYKDTEFRKKGNTQIEEFLKDNNILITLILTQDLDDQYVNELVVRRNFQSYSKKILEINGDAYSNKEFPRKLKELIFNSTQDKPTVRQIVSKNIRDEKNKLKNTLRVLHPTTNNAEYEALYLFWLGIDLDTSGRKQKLLADKKIEEDLQKRLRKDSNLSQIEQSLLVVQRTIDDLTGLKKSFNINKSFEDDLALLNRLKSDVNRLSTGISRLEMRKELIVESKTDLEKELSVIDTQQIKQLYEDAKTLVPQIQKTFEETLTFHNKMISEKIRFITQELPALERELSSKSRKMNELLVKEKELTGKLIKKGAIEELDQIISDLNNAHERKGNLEEKKRLWENSIEQLEKIKQELDVINQSIGNKDELIKQRIAEFNKYFSTLSNRLYGEQFVLSSDENEKGYELIISSISGNLGTGKKKGQIAAFDLAYIQFADAMDINCLHFILNDQIETVHTNQIDSLLTEIVSEINCQYVLPVLRDKLPPTVEVSQFEILSLSQEDKLFRVK